MNSFMQPLVSITMSTYNIETFIKESLNCVINQTLKNIEIICIDDGSTDNTLKILEEYAINDKRIKVFSKLKNEGLAVARNEALALATGKYICFVDGDDLMDLDLLKKAYELAEQEKSDLVLWDYISFWETKKISSQNRKPSSLLGVNSNDKLSLLKQPSFTWLKLIKTDIAKNINIHFPIGLTKQDIPVHWHLITKINNISILPEQLVYYRQQPNATSYKTDKRLLDIVSIIDITEKYLIESKLYQLYKNIFLKQKLELMYIMYDTIEVQFKKAALDKIKQRISSEEIQYINSSEKLIKQIRFFYLFLQGSFSSKIKYKFWLLSRRIYRQINKKKVCI